MRRKIKISKSRKIEILNAMLDMQEEYSPKVGMCSLFHTIIGSPYKYIYTLSSIDIKKSDSGLPRNHFIDRAPWWYGIGEREYRTAHIWLALMKQVINERGLWN